jgi:hypothetical protein
MVSKAAQELGKKGGQAKSAAKTAAVRANAKKPRGKWVTAIAYELDGIDKFKAFGSVIVRGSQPNGTEANHNWLTQKVKEHGVGLQNEDTLVFLQLSASSLKV